ncbi:MAG: sn-glycerol-3-phosphate ABC transporter ATP-binding protein UgpC [Alphaproteobacteria bacterium]|nr:sn-glycerol-3-phosphate ABC transporter ATP-binding protein UgpC [Alphaproteobacteria bacterium]
MAAITMRDVHKSFGDVHVIKGVDLHIDNKEFIVFVGPSGCGKSTLLRLVAGLEDITSGDMMFDGEEVNDLPPAERGIAMVFQSYALYPHMSVYDNMAFGLKLAKADQGGVDERVRKAAGILQIEHLLDRKPKQLSGGQRQRVAIGRAIVRDPKVFLFDEPLSNLDAALRVQMRIEIAKLHRSLDATMIYVTHDQVEAMTLADKIVVLNGGVVEQFGSPLELYHHPQNLFVAGFIGSPKMNFLEGDIASVSGNAITVGLPGGEQVIAPIAANGAAAGQKVTLGIRPEHLIDGGGGDAELKGKAIAVEQLGGETYAYLDRGGSEPLVIKAGGDAKITVDEVVPVGVQAQACYLFDEEGKAFQRAAA